MNKNRKQIFIIILILGIIILGSGLVFNFGSTSNKTKEKKKMTYEELKEFAEKKYGENAEKITINEDDKTFTIYVKSKESESEKNITDKIYLIDKETGRVIGEGVKAEGVATSGE